jgi:hypothetical protein
MSGTSAAATPRQKAMVGVLSAVLVTVLWFQFVWRGQHEASAGAVVDDSSAAAAVTDDTSALDGTGDATGTGPFAAGDATTDSPTATAAPAVPVDHVDHVAELRRVHQAVSATGVRLVGYVPATIDTAQVQLEGSYEGVVAFLAELRTRAPGAVIDSLAIEPQTTDLAVTFTVEWAS